MLDPEELKSETVKEKWRPFCLKFDGIVEDFTYVLCCDSTVHRATLKKTHFTYVLCCDSTVHRATLKKTPSLHPGYNFCAIGIAWTREGYNKAVYTGIKDKEEKEASNGGDKGGNSREEEKGADREGEKERSLQRNQQKQ